MMMHSWIELSGEALRHNYRAFAGLVGQERLAPVVKSNAYGHGLAETYRCLAPENPAWLCTNYVFEALSLRQLGFQGRLVVVGPSLPAEFADAAAAGIEVFLVSNEHLEAWLAAAQRPRIHVKIDTGMSRQGFRPADAADVARSLVPHKSAVVGICTHFANVEDVTEHEYASLQLAKFDEAVAAFAAQGLYPMQHAASSASTLILEKSRFGLSRVGISLYGVWPSQATRLSYLQTFQQVLELKPALSWRASVAIVKTVESGQFIGYGCAYRAVHPMRIAVLPVGYYEGFPRLAAGASSYVLLHGTRCPVVGRVCMNMMMVDITHVPGVVAGDTATLIGRDGGERLAASDVAAWAQTIHYELLTRLNPLLERRIVD